jgi:leucyl/phenylalanyl-tRNA--protein transferase
MTAAGWPVLGRPEPRDLARTFPSSRRWRTLRSGRFSVTRDADFAAVVTACADREETWINDDLEHAMLALHSSGHAHSVEVWSGETLVGGLYGVKLGRAFFGESMFSRMRDASKVALAWLVAAPGASRSSIQFHRACVCARERSASRETCALSRCAGQRRSCSNRRRAAPRSNCGNSPDFAALDRLLELAGAAGAGGPAGYVISQLLGQTS